MLRAIRGRSALRASFRMIATPTFDRLNQALAPVETLRGEHSMLEKWLRESFAALETLHEELDDWQRELTRQQAALDQREAAVADASEQVAADALAEVERRLASAREVNRQLQQENAEHVQARDSAEEQLAVAQADLRRAAARIDELTAALEAERQESAAQSRRWADEACESRQPLETAQGSYADEGS